jgi:hypothetical protein
MQVTVVMRVTIIKEVLRYYLEVIINFMEELMVQSLLMFQVTLVLIANCFSLKILIFIFEFQEFFSRYLFSSLQSFTFFFEFICLFFLLPKQEQDLLLNLLSFICKFPSRSNLILFTFHYPKQFHLI